MEPLAIGLSVVALVVVIGATMIILKKLQEMKELQLVSQNDKLISQLNENLQGVQKMVDKNMAGMRTSVDKTTDALNERLDNAAKVIGALKHELGGMKEIGRSISDFQAFLKSPKLRGNLGEQILYDALDQVFSNKQYATQHKFKEGQMVDAVINTAGGIIPIDSKFPMEAYQLILNSETQDQEKVAHREFVKAVRKHIRDISSKYILPQEGTVNYAVMYVPSEAVYYEVVLQQEELLQYSRDQRVLLVSPNTFYQFLHVIMMGMERAKIEEQAEQILQILNGVQKETEKFGEKLSVLNRHVTNAKNSMETVSGEYTKLSSKIDQVKLLE